MLCEHCCRPIVDDRCASCELYNGAVAAQQVAAQSIATARFPKAKRAWLNEHGIFAMVDGVTKRVGTAEESAPFCELTSAARCVDARPPKPEGA